MRISPVLKKLTKLIPFAVILILSLLPVFYTWGRLPIWGDTIIPFNSKGLEKYLYQWISLQNGQYFSLNYFPYFLFFKFIEIFTKNIYLISAVILFSLKVIAGLGIYKLAKLLYNEKREILYTIPIVFYLLSPAQLNASYYLYIYSFVPWFIYFIFKIIKYNRIMISDLVWLTLILFFASINLPNPKYVFHLFIISSIIFIASFFLKLININFFFKNFWKLIIFFLLSAYLILPQLVFVSYYSSEKYDVHIKAGYQDTGQMMDFGEATLSRMFKLHKDSLNLNENARKQYNSNILINFLSYLFVILIVVSVVFTNSRDNNHKKYQYLLLLLVVVYLFFAVGPNPPLGFLYKRLVENFSLLAFLRTTAGATFFLSIFYALLLFPVVLNQKTIKKQNLIFGLLIIAICIVGYPLLNGEFYKNVKFANPYTDTTKRGFIIPKDYFEIKEQLDSLKYDAKVLYPDYGLSYASTSWGFYGSPIYDFMYNTDNVSCEDITSPSLYNIGFILRDKTSLMQINCPLKTNEKDIVKRTEFIELSRIPKDLFIPHFYIPQNIVYSNGDIESLADIVSFDDWKIRSVVYLDENGKWKMENGNLLNRADEVFVKAELENAVDEKYFEKLEAFKNSVPFPYVRHEPGSFFYPLVLKKEQFEEWGVRKSSEKLIEKKLFYAGKRIAEIEKFGDEKNEGLTMEIGKKYQLKMEEVIKEVEKLEKQENKKNWVVKIRAYLEKHKEKLEEIEKLKPLEEIFASLDKKISPLEEKLDLQTLNYNFEIPKEEGYSLLIKGDELEQMSQIMVGINGETIATSSEKLRNDGWIDFGEKSFSQGKHKLTLHLTEIKNLVGNNWQNIKNPKIVIVKEGEEFSPSVQNLVFQEINDWTKEGLYYLTFDYLVEKGSVGVSILEEVNEIGDSKGKVKTKEIFSKILGEKKINKWERFEAIVGSSSESLGAKIYFFVFADPNQLAKVDFRNLKIHKIVQPRIMLYTSTDNTDEARRMPMIPGITFVKINSTKYKVKVEGAKEPYTLIFSESFHQGWKAYIQTSNIKHQAYGDEVASYFDGEIKEGTHKNIFLDKNTFETWRKKPISEERHSMVNGYANSWYITPEDAGAKEDYEIIIEFGPQRMFYLGLFISILTLVGCLGYLIFAFFRKKWKRISR